MKGKSLLFTILFTLGFSLLKGQVVPMSTSQVFLEVPEQIEQGKSPVISIVVKIGSKNHNNFQGFLRIVLPNGIKAISPQSLPVSFSDSMFIAVKLLAHNVPAGKNVIRFELENKQNETVTHSETFYTVDEKTLLRLINEQANIIYSNPNDSVRVAVTLANLGNVKVKSTVLFNIPDLMGQKNSFEKTSEINAGERKQVLFTFFPSKELVERSEYNVDITASYGTERILIGASKVQVQNLSSSKRFIIWDNNVVSNNLLTKGISLNYRTSGKNSELYQVFGGGNLDLPTGYLSFSGQLYSQNPDFKNAVLTNTKLQYYYNNNVFSVGNITKMTEITLYGRGAEAQLVSEDNKKQLEIGVIDQNYNIIDNVGWFQDSYGAYAIGSLAFTKSTQQKYTGGYVIKYDPYLQAHHNVGLAQGSYVFNKHWAVSGKISSAFSKYNSLNMDKTSIAEEFSYNGKLGKFLLNGNIFNSSDYFPGNRPGVLQIQQSVFRYSQTGYNFSANFTLSDYSPQTVFNSINFQSRNIYTNANLAFPSSTSWRFNAGYQNRYEKGNSYFKFGEVINGSSHVLTEQVSWASYGRKHSLMLNLENGLAWFEKRNKPQLQFRGRIVYGFYWFNVMAAYQSGSSNLSEYTHSINSAISDYSKVSAGFYFNKSFKKLNLASSLGGNFSKDQLLGIYYNFYSNLKYTPSKRIYAFLNLGFNQYRYTSYFGENSLSKMFSTEIGLSYILQRTIPSSKKKGRVDIFIFQDNNSNNIFDEGDTPAYDYPLEFNKVVFVSDRNGKISYTNLPYKEYQIKAGANKGWFNEENTVQLDKTRMEIQIPLHQTGIVKGEVKYSYDKRMTVGFTPKYGGIVFKFTSATGKVTEVYTDDSGNFLAFLPKGSYRIELDITSLPVNALYEEPPREISVIQGGITNVPQFIVGAKQRKVNIKKFVE